MTSRRTEVYRHPEIETFSKRPSELQYKVDNNFAKPFIIGCLQIRLRAAHPGLPHLIHHIIQLAHDRTLASS
jgi:hypothetical protein